MTAPVPPRSGVRRSRSGAVLGGVCAGIARSAGLDPLLLRVAVVAVTVLTGGAGLPAYLAAWVLIPREEAPAGAEPGMSRVHDTPDGGPAAPPPGAVPSPRSPLEAADDAATALGDRLRAPEVQDGARRAAASVSQAVAAGVDEVGRRVRRGRG